MLGVESKPNDTDRFKSDSHEKALEKLGFRGVFGGGLGGALGGLGASLGAALSMSTGDRGSVGVGGAVGLRDATVTSGVGVGLGDVRLGREKEGGLELVKPSLVLDIASLILYGCQALPIRLKILLDRLFSVLTHEDVLQVLHGFGWTYEDYARGYKLQDRQGNVLHSWHMMSTDEETLVLRQFLRFGETRAIAQQLLQHEGASPRPDHTPSIRDSHRDTLRDSHRDSMRDSHRDSLRDSHRDVLRDTHTLRDSHRDAFRDSHREMHRDALQRDGHRDARDMRDRDLLRDFREDIRREESRRDEPPRSQHQQPHLHPAQHHPHQPQPQPQSEMGKSIDSDLKKFLERTNMLFNPFMRGDPSSLLRPPPPTGPAGLPPAPPPLSAASLASNLLAAANPSLATSLLANPQLASSALSMLRLPVPPVSLPNLSPNNGSLPNSFGSPTSPMDGSPLNRLQSMQPFDFRKEPQSPSPASRPEPSFTHGGRGGGVTSPASSGGGGSGGGGGAPVSVSSGSVTPLAATATHQPPPTPVSVNSDPPTDYTSEDDDIAIAASTTALNLSTTSTTVATSATPTTLPMPPRPHSPGGGPSTPGKRSWNPINLGTSLINPVTGKKRVQCNVCLKTFCDKGALKIHFSAVHLREMHKCTVEGCNMMFSSRRSRNRHSANPNPKLHTPHVRRKISPHDGRTSSGHPVMMAHGFQPQQFQPPAGFPPLSSFPGQFSGINPLTGLPFIPPSAAATEDLHKQALELQRRTLEMQHAMGKSSLDLSMRGREDGMWRSDYGGFHGSSGQSEDGPMDSSLDGKRKDDEFDANNSLDGDMDDDSMSVDAHSMKGENPSASPSNNKRKRKSQNPTKFAFRLEDDDLISTDDDDDDDNDDDLDDIDAKDSEEDKNEDKELDAMSDDDDDDGALKEGSSTHSDKAKNDKDSDGSNRKVSSSSYDEAVDTSNALRHLEDLSKGHFAHLTGTMPPNASASLGLPMAPSGNGVTSSSPRPSDRDSDRDSNPGSPSEDSDGAFHFGEGGFLSSLDIPMDKENPRRCIACGKIFQNHFGVKTHYQNVHLKLMHKCTVEGCNAAFPSKRSRDRHSSNLNLHRKLLSTSSDAPGFPGMGFPGLPFNPALNPELLARLYSDPAGLPLGLDALKAHIPTSLAESLFNGDRGGSGGGNGGGGGVSGGGGLPPATHPPPHFFLPNLLPHFAANNNLPGTERKDRSSTPSPQSTTPTTTAPTVTGPTPASEAPSSSPPPSEVVAATTTTTTTSEALEQDWVYNLEDDLPSPDRDGNMPCRFCHKVFEDGVGLKSHYEEVHASELFRCTVEGCNKLFSARRKRNAHSLNEAYHKDLLEGAPTKDT